MPARDRRVGALEGCASLVALSHHCLSEQRTSCVCVQGWETLPSGCCPVVLGALGVPGTGKPLYAFRVPPRRRFASPRPSLRCLVPMVLAGSRRALAPRVCRE